MKLQTAITLGMLTAAQLSQHAKASGYTDTRVVGIRNVDIREHDVCYKVEFADPSGSFGDDEPVGNIYVSQNMNGQIQVEF